MGVGEALQSGGFADGDDPRLVRVDGAHRLVRAPVGTGSGAQRRTLAGPGQLGVATDRIDRAGHERGEAGGGDGSVRSLRVAREAAIGVAHRCSIGSGSTGPTEPPYVIAVVVIEPNSLGEVGDCAFDRGGRGLAACHIVKGEGDATILVDTEDEQSLPAGRGPKVRGIPDVRSQQGVPVRHEPERLLQNVPSVRVGEASDVFHHEELWFDFGDEPEEVAEKLTARIVLGTAADIAEPLARWAAKDAVDLAAGGGEERIPTQRGHILKV